MSLPLFALLAIPIAFGGTNMQFSDGWLVSVSRSSLDDSAHVEAGLLSTDGNFELHLQCRKDRTVASLIPLAIPPGDGAVRVRHRVNKERPVSSLWHFSLLGWLDAADPVSFIRLLPDDGRLQVRLGERGYFLRATFELKNVSAIRAKIANACKWPTS